MISFNLILFIYLYPVVRVLIIHWYMCIFASFLAKGNRNVFVQHGILCREKCTPMPILYVRTFSTADEHSEDSFLWDMDVIPFVIDNNATAIIIIQRRLFKGLLIPTQMNL